MAGAELPKGVGGVDPTERTKPLEGSDEGSPKPFEEYMQPNEAEPGTKAAQQAPSPAEVAKTNMPNTTPTMESVHDQMKATSSQLGDLQSQLQTPNLKLKPSQKYLLRNKLGEANSKIRDAATKAGVDVGEPIGNVGRNNPVIKFLGFVTDGMKQLNAAQSHIAEISKGGTNLKPAELLVVQTKLARAQQEIEYSSTILSNAISGLKTLFNTQI